jgi:MYXO-CTERM domain-containing protein
MGVTCAAGEVCDMGYCQPSCMCRECPMNYSCSSDGTCQPTDCIGLNCPPGQVCRSALLEEPGSMAHCVDPCDGAVCPEGQHCESGSCMPGAPPPDASTGDAASDAPATTEGGPTDGSATGDVAGGGDGSMDGATFGVHHSGCKCSTVGSSAPTQTSWLALFALASLAALARRTRRRVARPVRT